MGFALVGAAGSLAGSYAAEAIQGKPKEWGVDTSIPGISSATIKEGGKGGRGKETVPQVDITQSLKWFQQAAEEQTSYYEKGLSYYNKALMSAANEINAGYTKANNTLKPLSYASTQAMNEQMRMMGLDPIQSGGGIGTQLQSIYKDKGKIPDNIRALSDKLNNAINIKDPAEREATKKDILSQLSSLQTKSTALDQISALGDRPTKGIYNDEELARFQRIADGKVGLTEENAAYWIPEAKRRLKEDADARAASGKAWDEKVAALKAQDAQINALNSQLSDVANTFSTEYAPTYDRGYTGQEVADRITSTPGYQFQMDQGTKAIERQGAAKGMLGSGNTLMALTQYGQQLGQNFYGMYMDNLARITEQGSGATMQLAANQVNQSKDYGALLEAGGQAGMQTQQLIGNARAEQLYKSGQLYSDAAQFNAGLQYQGVQAGKGRDAQMAQAALGAQAGIMNAQTNQQMFNYDVFKGQQAGKTYAASRYGATV